MNSDNTQSAHDRRVSRQDVARAAGVSLTTVTHALNPVPGVRMSHETRERVQRIAREMGYRPSFVGRALVEGRTYTVGFLQPSYDVVFNNFYQMMMYGMAQAMEPDDYHLLALFRTDDHRYQKVITQGRVDGMLILQSDFDISHIERVAATGIPTVVVNKRVEVAGTQNLGWVHSDHQRMMADAVAEFSSLGCRTVLLVEDVHLCDANVQVAEGFACAVAGYADQGMVGTTLNPDRQHFAMQVRNAFAAGHRWDGIFIDGMGYADILLEEAERAGLAVGRDFHLITSDTMTGYTTRRRLETSVFTQQPELVSAEAWRLLQAMIHGPVEERTVLVPYRHEVLQGRSR